MGEWLIKTVKKLSLGLIETDKAARAVLFTLALCLILFSVINMISNSTPSPPETLPDQLPPPVPGTIN